MFCFSFTTEYDLVIIKAQYKAGNLEEVAKSFFKFQQTKVHSKGNG